MQQTAVLPRTEDRSARRPGRPAFVQRYWAFLSYSHQDEALAARLQTELERFRVPKRLIGRGTPFGLIPSRLAPVFRDRHELAAGHDLREDIAEALAASRFLIVLCSPAAATSRWTDEEIRLFKQHRPDGEVLAAIVSGEPWASDQPGRAADECFPPALKVEIGPDGTPTEFRAEPIAADLRGGRDGWQAGFMKLVAGMLDVGLDELVQRESQRRQRRMMAVTGASLVGMVAASGLALTAVTARDAARDQRRQAEGLVGFMLGDLKDRLEPIGRLDALDAVGARALGYYATQDKDSLSDDSLLQRSRALTLMGQIATSRGNLEGALVRYREAMATTGELIRRAPDDPRRLYDHAQNVFWVGDTALKRGQMAEAERQLRDYKALAERMVALDPGDDRYRQERRYADSNLGVLLLEQDRATAAVAVFRSALASSEVLLEGDPAKVSYQLGRSETLAWLSDALLKDGKIAEATGLRRQQLAFLDPLTAVPTSDSELRRQQAVAHYRLARLLALQGETAAAIAGLREAILLNDRLLAAEPDNATTLGNGIAQRLTLAEILLRDGSAREEAARLIARGCAGADALFRREPSAFQYRVEYRTDCQLARTRLALARGDSGTANDLAARAVALSGGDAAARQMSRLRVLHGRALTMQGVALNASSRGAEAGASFAAALRVVPPAAGPGATGVRWVAAAGAGDAALAGRLRGELAATGASDAWLARDLAVAAK